MHPAYTRVSLYINTPSSLKKRDNSVGNVGNVGKSEKSPENSPRKVFENAYIACTIYTDIGLKLLHGLHDTVEDCPLTSFPEIESEFDVNIANIVRELTDDKFLPKAERKRLQIVNAFKKSKRSLFY